MNIKELNNVMFKEFPDCVDSVQLAQMLGIKRTKTYELLKDGTIKSIKIGKDYKIHDDLPAVTYDSAGSKSRNPYRCRRRT